MPPTDLRYMNGMKKTDESVGKKSVEGFLTFLYHFVALRLQMEGGRDNLDLGRTCLTHVLQSANICIQGRAFGRAPG